jgi:hypothetical protein
MLDVFGFPSPQEANYQEFYGGGTVRDWIKPRGASMVRMLLIGAGAGGGTGTTSAGGQGGGSGNITQWIGPAIFIPDILRISIAAGAASDLSGTNTTVIYQQKDGTGYTLLTATGGAFGGGVNTADANNYFGAAGIYKSLAGTAGVAASTAVTASTTTFLSSGAGGSNTTGGAGAVVNCNYGYPQIAGGTAGNGGKGGSGFFITQPILLGAGGGGGGGATSGAGGDGGNGGIGCGGGGGGRSATGASSGGNGGDGAVFIWSW